MDQGFKLFFSMSFISKAMEDKDSFDFHGDSDGYLLLLFISLHCLLKNVEKLKDIDVFIYKELSKETIELRKKLWEQVLEYC